MTRKFLLWSLWNCAKRAVHPWRGYHAVGFWNHNKREGRIQFVQVWGPLFKVSTFTTCHTTGADLDPVDPWQIPNLLLGYK